MRGVRDDGWRGACTGTLSCYKIRYSNKRRKCTPVKLTVHNDKVERTRFILYTRGGRNGVDGLRRVWLISEYVCRAECARLRRWEGGRAAWGGRVPVVLRVEGRGTAETFRIKHYYNVVIWIIIYTPTCILFIERYKKYDALCMCLQRAVCSSC